MPCMGRTWLGSQADKLSAHGRRKERALVGKVAAVQYTAWQGRVVNPSKKGSAGRNKPHTHTPSGVAQQQLGKAKVHWEEGPSRQAAGRGQGPRAQTGIHTMSHGRVPPLHRQGQCC